MTDDVKPGDTPKEGQLSQQQLDAIVEKVAEGLAPVLDKRFSGFQSVIDKKMTELRDEVDTSPSYDGVSSTEPPAGSPSGRKLSRDRADLDAMILKFSKKQVALDLDVAEDNITGGSESEYRISALTYLVTHPKIDAKSDDKADNKTDDNPDTKPEDQTNIFGFTPMSQSGNPMTSSGDTTQEGMIQAGLKEKFQGMANK